MQGKKNVAGRSGEVIPLRDGAGVGEGGGADADDDAVPTSFKFNRKLRDELDAWAAERGISRTAAIHFCIATVVKKLDR